MYEAICEATSQASKITGAGLILSGNVIQSLREQTLEFDYKNGGKSLCRDGFHLSNVGRYATALTWLATLTKNPVLPLPFLDLDPTVNAEICKIVNEVVFNS